MKCTKVLSLFSRYLEDDIDDLTRNEIDQHLRQCSSCTSELSVFTKSIRIINAALKVNLQGNTILKSHRVVVKCYVGLQEPVNYQKFRL